MNLARKIKKHITNIPGWRTSRRIVVIESDDWGSIRMPSRTVYEKCLKAGYPVDKIAYERYDSLLSQRDLELLFDLLTRFKDKNGNHPTITANCVVANPDFEKIEQSNFRRYYYELITETFKRYPNHSQNFNIWQQGLHYQIFYPQFHGREHLNVSFFMDALRKGDRDALFGFENQMPGSIPRGPVVKGNPFVEATKYNSAEDKQQKLAIFIEGLDLFKGLFGYMSETIIPPNYTWSQDFNSAVFEKGVKYFQGIRKMCEPVPGKKNKYHTFYLGRKNSLGQIYLMRNVLFEPSLFRPKLNDPVGQCLSDMAVAFRLHKPSVITSHRINYCGYIDESNRDRTLIMLHQLFHLAIKRWPDIEFMTSSQLGQIINSSF